MSIIRADSIKNSAGTGAHDFPNGITVTGIVTASTLNQTPTSIVVGSAVTANSQGIDVTGVVTATSFKGSGANLTSLPSAQLTGALPAISGANLTGIAADKIFEGNTEVETVDTGSDGHIKFTTEGTEKARITTAGRFKISTYSHLCAIGMRSLSGNSSSSNMHNANEDLYFSTATHPGANTDVYNTSNGRYTAPVRGLYLVNFRGLLDDSMTSTGSLRIYINGSDSNIIMYYEAGNNKYQAVGSSTILNLNANDYFTFKGTSYLHISQETQFSACLLQHY